MTQVFGPVSCGDGSVSGVLGEPSSDGSRGKEAPLESMTKPDRTWRQLTHSLRPLRVGPFLLRVTGWSLRNIFQYLLVGTLFDEDCPPMTEEGIR